jgi:glucan 1,3-beta-glucosidase
LFTQLHQTESDFAQIAGAGLNWIRLPIPFWSISTLLTDPTNLNSSKYTTAPLTPSTPLNEPFLARLSFTYLLRALTWARKYGLRVLIEIHTAPGSQNGYNHSGRVGQINWLYGVMGLANVERFVDQIEAFVDYFWGGGVGEWSDVVGMFGLVNEALIRIIGEEPLTNL